MGTFSIWHWIIVLVIVVLVFGTKKLRNLGSDLGGALKGFKDGMKEADTGNQSPHQSHDNVIDVSSKRESTPQHFHDSINKDSSAKTTQHTIEK